MDDFGKSMPRNHHIMPPFSTRESDYDYNFVSFGGTLIVIRYIVVIVMDVFEMRIDDHLIIYDMKRFDRIDRRIHEQGLMRNSGSSIDKHPSLYKSYNFERSLKVL